MINKVSKRWSNETKDLINNSKLNLIRVYDNTFVDSDTSDVLQSHSLTETCHCDFCGQRIKYVSVLEFDKNKNLLYFQIGKECMSYLFDYGMRINGLDNARYQIENSVKKLMKQSSERARAEKYKAEFDVYLKWLDSLDSEFIQKNSFLRFINNRLRTGDGVVTMKMMAALDRVIKKYTPENTSHIEEKRQKLLKKINFLLNEIQILYDKNYQSNSTYKFVNSVYEYVSKNGNATIKQLNVLNDISKRMKNERTKASDKKVDITIPW